MAGSTQWMSLVLVALVFAVFSCPSSVSSLREKRDSSTTYYIDVLPVVEYSLYQRFLSKSSGETQAVNEIKAYYRHLFSAIVKYFNTLNLQSYKLQIQMMDPEILKAPYDPFEQLKTEVTVGTEQRIKVDATQLLSVFEQWVTSKTDLIYDIIMLFSSHDLTGGKDDDITFISKGLANIGTVCQGSKASAVVEDKGAYQSEGVAAHELAHIVGAFHDGDGNTCLSSSRFLMSDGTYTQTSGNKFNPWSFSSCSSDGIKAIIDLVADNAGYLANCLQASSGEFVTDQVVVQANQQCQDFFGAESFVCRGTQYPSFSEVCTKFYCYMPGTMKCRGMHTATGTCCGNQKMCEEGVCKNASVGQCSLDEECPLGDQPTEVKDGKTCAQLPTNECYLEDIKLRCCSSCRDRRSTQEGCPYGDKRTGCDVTNCATTLANDVAYSFMCCQTCLGVTCQDVTSFNINQNGEVTTTNCPDLIQSFDKKVCYVGDIHKTFCCITCEGLRSSENVDCPWGDREDCSNLWLTVPPTCGADKQKSCCKTCAEIEARNQQQETTAPTTTDGSGGTDGSGSGGSDGSGGTGSGGTGSGGTGSGGTGSGGTGSGGSGSGGSGSGSGGPEDGASAISSYASPILLVSICIFLHAGLS